MSEKSEDELEGSGLSYRLSPELGMELVPSVTSALVEPLGYSPDGLRGIALKNFTGRILFRRVVTSSVSDRSLNSLHTDTSASSNHEDNHGLILPTGSGSSNYEDNHSFILPTGSGSSNGFVLATGLEPPATSNDYPANLSPSSDFVDEASSQLQRKTSKRGLFRKLAAVGGATAVSIAATSENTDTEEGPLPTTEESESSKAPPKKMGMYDLAKNAMTAQKMQNIHKRSKSYAASTLRKIKNVTVVKPTIPDEVRTQRSEKRMSEKNKFLRNQDEGGSNASVATTPLHDLCNSDDGDDLTLEALFDCLNDNPKAIWTKDEAGRYPLHILGDNDTLITTDSGRNVATVFSVHLINEFPAAVTSPDGDGYVPFTRILADWIDWTNNQEKTKKEQGESTDSFADRTSYYTGHDGGIFDVSRGAATLHWHIGTVQRRVYPRVEVWEEVEWCITMLTTVLDILARNQNVPMFQRLRMNAARHPLHNTKTRNLWSDDAALDDERDVLVNALVEKMPSLVNTMLLVDDDGMDTRTRLLEKGLFKRLMLSPAVVGKWLVLMLCHGGVPAIRAVDFLAMISRVKIEDYTGGLSTPHSSDWDSFNRQRKLVFESVGSLKGTIASLVSLEAKETERAASTAVVWHIMSSKLSQPFVLGLVLVDLVLHFTLMVSFRSMALVDSKLSSLEINPAGVIVFISMHYMVRKCCEAWVMLTVSPAAFKSYFSNIWTLFDIIAVLLTLLVAIFEEGNEQKYLTGLNTFTMGLLWIKILGFLKIVNKEMSTFIQALTQILYDIRLFMVVLAVVVFMFGDMFHIAVSTKDDGQYCKNDEFDSGAIENYCSNTWESYLRTYSILLGDFELDEIAVTNGTTILFVIFTVFGVVILLNVLIAVISDSYEKATISSSLLFGSARVLYVAQNEALEEFLRPRSQAESGKHAHKSGHHMARRIIRWSMLLIILATAIYVELFLVNVMILSGTKGNYFYLVALAIFSLILLCALWILITYILDRLFRAILPERAENVYDWVGRVNVHFVRLISNALFGLKKEKTGFSSLKESIEEDWTGRIKYLENMMEQMMSETKNELRAEILEMRADMHDHFDDFEDRNKNADE